MTSPNRNDLSSLQSLFAEAERQRLALETSSSAPAGLEAALEAYAACERAVAQRAVFSPNESIEDVTTAYLPYLLIEYRFAELAQRLPTDSPARRRLVLRRTRAAYEQFLARADVYSLLPPAYAALHARYLESPASFSTLGGGGDPAARRVAKIANLKAERALRHRFEALRSRRRDQQPSHRGRPEAVGAVDEDDEDEDGADEEIVREAHLAQVAFAVHMAFQGLEGLAREEEVLAQAPETVEDVRWIRDADADADSGRLDRPLESGRGSLVGGGGPLLSRDGKPLRPFHLVSARREVTAGVFRPGHNLPTMSIDEYLAEERRRGNILEGGGEASMRGSGPEPDEDDVDRADAETVKARAWDDFKEANPRGWGNTLNRG